MFKIGRLLTIWTMIALSYHKELEFALEDNRRRSYHTEATTRKLLKIVIGTSLLTQLS